MPKNLKTNQQQVRFADFRNKQDDNLIIESKY